MTQKPHMGRIDNWWKRPAYQAKGLGYVIQGDFLDHPHINGFGHTSYVVKHDGDEVETRNSRYTLLKPHALRGGE